MSKSNGSVVIVNITDNGQSAVLDKLKINVEGRRDTPFVTDEGWYCILFDDREFKLVDLDSGHHTESLYTFDDLINHDPIDGFQLKQDRHAIRLR